MSRPAEPFGRSGPTPRRILLSVASVLVRLAPLIGVILLIVFAEEIAGVISDLFVSTLPTIESPTSTTIVIDSVP